MIIWTDLGAYHVSYLSFGGLFQNILLIQISIKIVLTIDHLRYLWSKVICINDEKYIFLELISLKQHN